MIKLNHIYEINEIQYRYIGNINNVYKFINICYDNYTIVDYMMINISIPKNTSIEQIYDLKEIFII